MTSFKSISIGTVAAVTALTLSTSPFTVHAQPAPDSAPLTPASIVEAGATSIQMHTITNGVDSDTNAGYQDDKGTPIANQSYFRAGSITKTFISTVLLQLVDEGKVDLDATVDTYIPGKINDGDKITVRQILNHTSGVQEYLDKIPLYNVSSYPTTNDKLKEMLAAGYNSDQLLGFINAKPLASEPGSKFSYANANFVIAGAIIDKVTDKPYAKNIEERILQPLQMNHTVLPGTDQNVPAPAARAYEDLSDPIVGGLGIVEMTNQNASQVNASGEMISTTADLATFNRALINGELLSADRLKDMTTPSAASPGYGLGLMAMNTPCGVAYGHGGNLYGYASQMFSKADGSKQVAISGTEGKMDYFTVTGNTSRLAAQTLCE